MPSKNTVKMYVPHSAYHIYNRGVDKNIIFNSQQDYRIFRSFLEEYLTPPETMVKKILRRGKSRQRTVARTRLYLGRKNYAHKIRLLSYCLMPNHYHLLVFQRHDAKGIAKFTQSLCTRYSMYVNRKYERFGSLFQGIYKARRISNDKELLRVARYIHRNPMKLVGQIEDYKWSDYKYIARNNSPDWLYSETVKQVFSKSTLAKAYGSYMGYVRVEPSEGWTSL